jgi:hypothetical protein
MDRPIKPEVAIRAAAAMVVLVSCKNVLGLLPLEARQRLMVNWSESLEISADDAEDYFEKAADVQLPMALAVDLRDPVLRLTTTLKSRLSKQGHSRMDFAEMAVNLAELVCNGGAA